MSQITLAEQAAPSTPASGYVALYPKSDGFFYSKDDAGTESLVSFTAATQAQQETGTSLVVAVTPGTQQYHQSAGKMWIQADASGNISASYNVASITDGGTGLITVTIATDFSSATYTILGIAELSSNVIRVGITSHSAGSFNARGNAATDTLTDPDFWFFACFGDQA